MAKNGYKKISNDGNTEKIRFFSLPFFQWMNSVFKSGSQRPLQESDFLPLSEENTSRFVIDRLETRWEKEKTKCKENGKTPRLWKSVLEMLSFKNVIPLILTSGLYTLSCTLQPLLLGYLVTSLMSAEPQENYVLYGCALTMGINTLMMCLSMHHFDYQSELLGIRFSSALKGLIYLKVSNNLWTPWGNSYIKATYGASKIFKIGSV